MLLFGVCWEKRTAFIGCGVSVMCQALCQPLNSGPVRLDVIIRLYGWGYRGQTAAAPESQSWSLTKGSLEPRPFWLKICLLSNIIMSSLRYGNMK